MSPSDLKSGDRRSGFKNLYFYRQIFQKIWFLLEILVVNSKMSVFQVKCAIYSYNCANYFSYLSKVTVFHATCLLCMITYNKILFNDPFTTPRPPRPVPKSGFCDTPNPQDWRICTWEIWKQLKRCCKWYRDIEVLWMSSVKGRKIGSVMYLEVKTC